MNKVHAALLEFLVLGSGAGILAVRASAGERHDLPPTLERGLIAPIDRTTLPMVDAEEMKRLERYLPSPGPYRFGVELPVDLSPWNAGRWTTVGSDRVWRLRIESTGAFSLHLLFDVFQLAPGGRFYAYGDDPTAAIAGPFTARDNRPDGLFATQPLPGSALTLEYIEPANSPPGGFHVSHVVHGYRDAFGFGASAKAATAGASGSCNINVNCPAGATHADVKQSVAFIVLGGGSCSGGLLNNTNQDGDRLLLTANHCAAGAPAPGQWTFVFNYEVAGCSGNTGPKTNSLNGGVLIAKAANADYCLVRIGPQIPPAYKAYFAGYDATGQAVTNSVGIHHPQGDPRKICFDNEAPGKQVWQNADTWHVLKWDLGVTEPGSSGSPLFDSNKLVIGQLYGGTAACGNPIDDYYGRLETTVKNAAVAAALDPIGNAPTILPGVDASVVLDVDYAALSISGPATAEQFQTISVDRDVASVGGFLPTTYSYQIRLSGDAVIDSSDVVLDSGVTTTFGLVGSEVTIPESVALGAYYLGLTVDPDPAELNLGDNVVLGTPITIQASTAPDTTAVAIAGPASAERGSQILVDYTVAANAFVTGSITVELRMTADDVVTSSDALLGITQAVAPGPNQALVTVPASLPVGTYRYALVVVVQDGELDGADNSTLGDFVSVTNPPVPPPDVVAIGITGPAKAKAGKKAKLSIELDKGSFAGKVSYTVRLSQDPTITSDDVAIGSFKTKKSGTVKIEPKLPTTLAGGTYFWGVTIDGVADEVEFGNNAAAGGSVVIKPKT